MNKTPEEIISLVRSAGVIGAAGMGYPTYAKLQLSVETVIVNGSECEPLLYSDKTILRERALDVVEGLRIMMHAMRAREGVIAVNCRDSDGAQSIQNAILAGDENIRVHLLGDYYPAGDEFLMVYDVTKKVIPEGGTPYSVGVAVANVFTVAQIYQAVNGLAVTERVVTITGEVREPKVLVAPLGTPYSELIKLAGGPTLKEYSVLDGGPMMGEIISNLNDGIGKTTSGIVVLPSDHFAIKMKATTVNQMVKQSKAACDQCGRCTDLCPRSLLGHEINPDTTMSATGYNLSEPSHAITSAFLCSGCGICEIAACDSMHLSPKKIFTEYKRLLTLAGVKNPHVRTGFSVHSQYENRKISTDMLMKKLGILHYSKPLLSERMKEVHLVKIPLHQHIGAKASVTVKLGQNVRRGDMIAMSPTDQLGSIYHASIHGKISEVTEHYVEITGLLS